MRAKVNQSVSSGLLLGRIEEWSAELLRIADWWETRGVDQDHGGFFGEICNRGEPRPNAPKGVVAQSRMCWFFSAIALHTNDNRYRELALMARNFLLDRYVDRDNGGVFWEVDFAGRATNRRKQAYGQAFVLYALSTHYRLTADHLSRDVAYEIFSAMERHFRDRKHGGYWEALSVDWSPIDDVRLSEKDAPFPKSMNTHLHIMEAYSELFAAAPRDDVGEALGHLVDLHIDRIARPDGAHLGLFWDSDWTDHSTQVSFGHDIEASWLLWEAAERLGDAAKLKRARPVVLSLANSALAEGAGPNGELYNERSLIDGHLDRARVWWAQAEAMVGHLNAYQLSGEPAQLARVDALWRFIQDHIVELEGGEWRWYSRLDDHELPYSGGPWKAAYHNGRALMECISRARLLDTP